MKSLKVFLPGVVVLGVLGFAIWQVRSAAEAQAANVEARGASAQAAPAAPLNPYAR